MIESNMSFRIQQEYNRELFVKRMSGLEQARFVYGYLLNGAPTQLLHTWREAGEPNIMALTYDHLPLPNIYLLSDPELVQRVIPVGSNTRDAVDGKCPFDRGGLIIESERASRGIMRLMPGSDYLTIPTDNEFTNRKRTWLRALNGKDIDTEQLGAFTQEALGNLLRQGVTSDTVFELDAIAIRYMSHNVWGCPLSVEDAKSLSMGARSANRELAYRFLSTWQSSRFGKLASFARSSDAAAQIFKKIFSGSRESQWITDMQNLGYKEDDIINDMWGMCFGVRAVGNMIQGTMYELDKKPEIAVSLRKSNDDSRYIDAMLEGERLYPGGWISPREVTRDTQLIIGNTCINMPRGSYIAHSSFLNGRSSALWGDTVDDYDPDRYASDETRKTARYHAFGTGPRRCPGEKLVQATVPHILKDVITSVDAHFQSPLILNNYAETLAPRKRPKIEFTAV